MTDKVMGGVAITGTLADVMITKSMLAEGGYKETNLFLDDHPSDTSLGLYNALFVLGFVALANYTPVEYRKYILATWGFISWSSYYKNYKLRSK